MRVIAGLAKGRRLVVPEGGRTRAATDRIRETLFGILTPVLADGSAGELVRTWSSMSAIDLQEQDTRVQPDGSIIAVATLQRPDGVLGLLRRERT